MTGKDVPIVDEWQRLAALRRAGDADALLAELDNPKEATEHVLRREVSQTVRGRAALELARLKKHGTTAAIAKLLNDSSFSVRADAAIALGKLQDQTAEAFLVDALKDPEADIRGCAARSLGELRNATALPALTAALRDDNRQVRVIAAKALARIGRREAGTSISAAARDESIRHISVKFRLFMSLFALYWHDLRRRFS